VQVAAGQGGPAVSQGADHGVVPGNGGRYGVGVEHVAGHLPQARLQAQPPGGTDENGDLVPGRPARRERVGHLQQRRAPRPLTVPACPAAATFCGMTADGGAGPPARAIPRHRASGCAASWSRLRSGCWQPTVTPNGCRSGPWRPKRRSPRRRCTAALALCAYLG
jgi:hypothetical protein